MKTPLLLTLLIPATLLAKEVSLMGGHLTIDLPGAAKPGTSHREAEGPVSGTDETIYRIGDGNKRIDVLACELFESAGPDFTKAYQEALRECTPPDFEIRTAGDNIVYALATKPAEEPFHSNVYGIAYVRSKDGTVQWVEFRFAAEAAKDIVGARGLITKAVTSIKDGGWSPDLSARTVTFGKEWGLDISIPVPEGYFFSHDHSTDYDIYRLKEVRRPGTGNARTGHGGLCVFYVSRDPGITEAMDNCKNLRKGKMLGKDIKWCMFPARIDYEQDNAYFLLKLGDTAYMHIDLYADTPEKLGKLISVAEGLSIHRKGGRK